MFDKFFDYVTKNRRFSIEDVTGYCIIDVSQWVIVENVLKDVLFAPMGNTIRLINNNGTLDIFKGELINCSIMKESQLGLELSGEKKITKSLSTISNELLDSKEIKGELKKILETPRPICSGPNEQKLIVYNPTLTDTVVDLLTNYSICIKRLLQFLRSRCDMDEGEYNELYHLRDHPYITSAKGLGG